jgi:hypothetical protein
MSAPNTQHQNFISNYAAAINNLLAARGMLKALREQDGAASVANSGTGIVASLTSDDFAGNNAYLLGTSSPGALITAAFATMDELESLLTNFATTPPTPTAALAALTAFKP